MFESRPTALDGCLELRPRVLEDERGRFVKVFHEGAFALLGLATGFAEEYYSRSYKGVVRGMHFQTPPMDHVKLVYCVEGEVLDVVLDLRVGSPTYGQTATLRLSAAEGNAIYIPRGLAHGFCVTSEAATLVYKVGTVHAPAHDSGVRWDSIGVAWPTDAPVVSARDRGLVPLCDFTSPFVDERA